MASNIVDHFETDNLRDLYRDIEASDQKIEREKKELKISVETI